MFKKLLLTFMYTSLLLTGIALAEIKVLTIDFVSETLSREHYKKIVSSVTGNQDSRDGWEFESHFNGMKARVINNDNDTSRILISWNGLRRTITTPYTVTDVLWRPQHNDFIYTMFVPGLDDFGECKIHYVTIKKNKNTLIVRDKEIADQLNTDLSWSSDGKYLCYSIASKLIIEDFNTHKRWESRKIILDNGYIIYPVNTEMIGGFHWVKRDKEIAFYWKYHPMDDKMAGYGLIRLPKELR